MHIGIDIVSLRDFQTIKKKDYPHWQRVFTKREWTYAFHDAHAREHLGGMFAAKEAAMKATGKTGLNHLLRFEVLHNRAGAPSITLPGALVSISHSREYAVALVIIP